MPSKKQGKKLKIELRLELGTTISLAQYESVKGKVYLTVSGTTTDPKVKESVEKLWDKMSPIINDKLDRMLSQRVALELQRKDESNSLVEHYKKMADSFFNI
jgi:hypothetical protein